ncbi:hypothetical protein GJAV_G00136110 [Gymnothorax javanicus]|nr:hypothetical protein GJAV_G00136110 [Gymnothorax javanicus]
MHMHRIMAPGNISNSLDNNSCMIQDGFLSLVLPPCYSLIFIIGLLSNVVAAGVFFRRARSDSSLTIYMRHMALADLLLVLCLPVRIYYHHQLGPYHLCRAVGIFFYVNMYASILFLCLISLDRYLKIMKPVGVFRFQRVGWGRRTAYAVWAVLACGTLPFLFGKHDTEPCSEICFHFHKKGLSGGVINLLMILLFFIITLFFLAFYGQIGGKLWGLSLGNDEQACKKKRRVIAKTFVVPVVFAVCFVPYHGVRIPYVLSQMDVTSDPDAKQMLHFLNELSLCLSALNSCLDPVIYFFLSSTFRKTIICVLHGKFKKIYDLNQRRSSIVKSVTEL